ncbi:DUF4870 domain-containing protein [Marinicrinis sediminis]|uniref:DUF4870 domain-containing protein n=1 Tax=Marinicrinis sediminis TaxID=1652465 RepID=A0ABW5RG48_9BACL
MVEPQKNPFHKGVEGIPQQDRVFAALAYVLFFLPLLNQPPSRYSLFHANQGLMLLLVAIVVNIIGAFVPLIGWLFILPFGNLAVLILAIYGIIHALQGEKKPLPLIGQYHLLDKSA